MENLTPRQIVAELDQYIIGQQEAKKSLAIALRNRYRRKRLPPELQEEIAPKNIILIGPTGVGKTELARRLAKLVNAPFVKVEATKFTEVGYVGRDVDSMVRDLVETSVRMVKQEKMNTVKSRAEQMVEERLLDLLLPRTGHSPRNPMDILFGNRPDPAPGDISKKAEQTRYEEQRLIFRQKLRRKEIEDHLVEVEVEDRSKPMAGMFVGSGLEDIGLNLQDMLGGLLPKQKKRRHLTIAEARKILIQEEGDKLIDMEEVQAEGLHRAEQEGIVFIDEIDKIAGRDSAGGPDVSRGGVQRDILPLVEGSTVVTKYGAIRTDYILFIAAGAFHTAKPSDLIPELQGRFPIRVELNSLSQADFCRILREPQHSLIKQYTALLKAEGIAVEFSDDAIAEIAQIAYTVNTQTENIGARRLHTILERVLQDLFFEAPDLVLSRVVIDGKYVRERLGSLVANRDLSRYIL